MEKALRSLLLAASAVQSVVERRIDWGLRPQGSSLPAVALHQVSGVSQMNLAAPSGWTMSRVQADSWGRTFSAASDLADVVAPVVHGLRTIVDGMKLRIFVVGRRSDDDSDDTGPLFRTSLDLMVWHTL